MIYDGHEQAMSAVSNETVSIWIVTYRPIIRQDPSTSFASIGLDVSRKAQGNWMRVNVFEVTA